MLEQFYTVAEVAQKLNCSQAFVRAVIKRGQLKAIQLNRHSAFRISASALEDYLNAQLAAHKQA